MALTLAFTDQGNGAHDLSALGASDWFVYPNSLAPVKKSGTPKLAVSVLSGTSGPAAYNNAYASLTWSDGNPTASGSTIGGIYCGAGQSGDFGWTITAPAGTGLRKLRIFCGTYLGTMRIAASLSDGSAVAISDATTVGTVQSPEHNEIATLDYSAASDNQTLTVKITIENSINGGSSLSLRAAALSVISADGGGDIIKPTIAAAAVANGSPTVVSLTASENLDGANVPAASAFTVTGHAVQSVAISGAAINLTVAPAFANGEAARTVSYAQPGTNNARDAAGNLLDSFSNLSITNNVQPAGDTTPPAFVSAQVTNSQTSVIQITMSETLAASVPPASAFAVSGGKAVSSVSIAGAVISLTVNSPYASGDAITVAYTQPGTNPRLQDAAGNLAGTFAAQPVTNNALTGGFGTFLTDKWTEAETSIRANQAFTGTWYGAGVPGTAGGTATLVSGTLSAQGRATITAPKGAGFFIGATADGGRFYQEGTVA